MDIRQLETFIQVARLKSFSKAAEKLFITQPTVTNHIQNLEQELGTLLINRSGKNISLTDAGSLFYKHAINIINSCEMAKFDLSAYKGSIRGHLHIYSSSVPRKYILPRILAEFAKKYPYVKYSINNMDSRDIVNSILEGDTDFGIVGAKFPSNKLKYIELFVDELLVITPNTKKFPKPSYSTINVNELLKEKIILREEGSGTRHILIRELKNRNINQNELNVVGYIEDVETIKELVSLGFGISFMSKMGVADDIKLDKYKAYYIEGLELKRKFYFVYHSKRQLSPLNETFKSFVIEVIKKSNNE
ncbi:MAG: LysR family transcriptional regulator [Tissierellia bacterium]|nr:LysR family transcriptional regulator [Tissierellia bacterium]